MKYSTTHIEIYKGIKTTLTINAAGWVTHTIEEPLKTDTSKTETSAIVIWPKNNTLADRVHRKASFYDSWDEAQYALDKLHDNIKSEYEIGAMWEYNAR